MHLLSTRGLTGLAVPVVLLMAVLGYGAVRQWIELQSGTVVATVTVGLEPVALALDDATGRLYVVNKDGMEPAGNVRDPWAWLPSWLRPWLPLPPAPRPPGNDSTVTVVDTSRFASP